MLLTPPRSTPGKGHSSKAKVDGKRSFTDKMERRIGGPEGQAYYVRRFATVESVFSSGDLWFAFLGYVEAKSAGGLAASG